MLQLTFNPGLTLTGFRTTRPWTLTIISGPYSTETLKDFMGQGKVFIRPLQKDLSMNAVASTTLVRYDIFFDIHFFVSPCGHVK